MSNKDILQSNIEDLKIGYQLAEDKNNNILKFYINNQLAFFSKDNIPLDYKFLAQSYGIDLVFLIQVCSLEKDNEKYNYYKNQLRKLCTYFPFIKEKREVLELI